METVVPTEVIRITHSSQRECRHSKEIKEAGGVQTWSMKYDMCHKQRLSPHGSLPTLSSAQPVLFNSRQDACNYEEQEKRNS